MAFLGTVMAYHDGYEAELAGDLIEKYAEMAEAAWQRIGFPTVRHEQIIDDIPGTVRHLDRAEKHI